MTPQKRLQFEEQHQENLAKLVSGHNPDAANLPPGVLQLWFTLCKELLKETWSSALDREVRPKQILAEVNEHKREILAGTKGTPDWERLMPVSWKHYWCWHTRELGAFLKELDRQLSAEISRWFELAQEADLLQRRLIARNINFYRKQFNFTATGSCGRDATTLRHNQESYAEHES
ncbi:MAG: hypothetical protein ACR2JB_23640 [Bryobacteraceae bacterium]